MKKGLISVLIFMLLMVFSYVIFQKKQIVSLETFTIIPSQIEGFSCFIFNSKQNMIEKKYLGIGDDSYDFFLSINGQLTEFLKKNGVLATDLYKLKIEQKNSGIVGNEYYEILGKLIITDIKNNTNVSKDFVGYCSW